MNDMGLVIFFAGIVVVWIVVSGLRREKAASIDRRKKIKETYPNRDIPNTTASVGIASSVISGAAMEVRPSDDVAPTRDIERDPIVVVNPKPGAPLGEWLLIWHEKRWNRQLRLQIDRFVEQRILVRQVVSRQGVGVRGKLFPNMTDWEANFVDIQQVIDPLTGEIFDPTLWFWSLVDFQKKLSKEKRKKN